MKGNQGLDALATLCGGASKANEVGAQKIPIAGTNEVTATTPPVVTSFQQQCAFALTQAALNPIVANSSSETQKWEKSMQHVASYNSIPSNVAAILSAAGSGFSQQAPSAPSPQFASGETSNALQQLAYLNLLQNQASSNQVLHQPQNSGSSTYGIDTNAAMAIFLATQQQEQQQALALAQPNSVSTTSGTGNANGVLFTQPNQVKFNNHFQNSNNQKQYHQIIPTAAQKSEGLQHDNKNSMKPPPIPYHSIQNHPTPSLPAGIQPTISMPRATGDSSLSNAGTNTPTPISSRPSVPLKPILMRRPQTEESIPITSEGKDKSQPASKNDPSDDQDECESSSGVVLDPDEKKQLKRAANRRSAQLSRKRKKQFIEELNKENDELRRKEQILRSIPDLVLVFDSAGKLWFVSHSVSHFLNYTPAELEGTSLWSRLCDESVRLIKSAFMDALAAKTVDSETTPLGSGVWELRMQDKDGSHKWVALNGVVHFSGDAPECVCSIRPREGSGINCCQRPSLKFCSSTLQQKSNTELQQKGKSFRKGYSNIPSQSRQSQQPQLAADPRLAHTISDSGSVISE